MICRYTTVTLTGRADLTDSKEVELSAKIAEAAAALGAADAVLITAGAGMGVDSGLPDFRGKEGFWRAYPALAHLGLSFEEMANPAWFNQDPHLAWAFYGHRLHLYRETEPHSGFRQLLRIAAGKPCGYFVFTSNVDGQFQKAGFASERIVECHGSIHHFQCAASCTGEIWDAGAETVAIDTNGFRALNPLPACRHCGAPARPNVLMFGDWSWLEQRTALQMQGFSEWLDRLAAASRKIVVIELGAGGAIPTVRQTSERVKDRFHGKLVRVNTREAQAPDGQIGLPMGAAEAMAQLDAALR